MDNQQEVEAQLFEYLGRTVFEVQLLRRINTDLQAKLAETTNDSSDRPDVEPHREA